MEEKKSVFREISLERINSPEQLNEYIRVAKPGVWIILVGIIILLAGMCVWGIFGKMESSFVAPVVVDKDIAIMYIDDGRINSIAKDMTLTVDGKRAKVVSISGQPVKAWTVNNEYALYVGALDKETWVYSCIIELEQESLGDGVYKANIVTESISPMSFFTN